MTIGRLGKQSSRRGHLDAEIPGILREKGAPAAPSAAGPNSLSPVSPSRWSSQAQTMNQRLPAGERRRPADDERLGSSTRRNNRRFNRRAAI
jgi:hypothetical protein